MCSSCAQTGIAVAESIGLEPSATRFISIATAAVMLFSLATPLVNPTTSVKTGAFCTKANQKVVKSGKTFVCKKSGKKLVWRIQAKRAAKPATKPATTPTPVPASTVEPFVPWSTTFEIKSLIKSAIDSTDTYAGTVSPDNSFDITIQNSVSASDRKWIVDMLAYTNGFFSRIEREKLSVYLGNSHEWSKETLRAAGVWLGDPNGTYPCSDGRQDAGCAGYKNLVLWIFMNPPQIWDVGRRSIPAHEVFHTIQFSLLGYNIQRIGPGHPQGIPRWFREGSANYFGYYMVQKLGFDSYENGRNSQVRFKPEYRNLMPLSSYDNYETNPYGIGQAATEYIVASVGFQSLLNILKFSGTEGSFSAGFKKATGLELSEFYLKFEEARKFMEIGS